VWSTKTPDGTWVGDFTQFKMFFLFNRNKLPVCLVGGCHNSFIDASFMKLLMDPNEDDHNKFLLIQQPFLD